MLIGISTLLRGVISIATVPYGATEVVYNVNTELVVSALDLLTPAGPWWFKMPQLTGLPSKRSLLIFCGLCTPHHLRTVRLLRPTRYQQQGAAVSFYRMKLSSGRLRTSLPWTKKERTNLLAKSRGTLDGKCVLPLVAKGTASGCHIPKHIKICPDDEKHGISDIFHTTLDYISG